MTTGDWFVFALLVAFIPVYVACDIWAWRLLVKRCRTFIETIRSELKAAK